MSAYRESTYNELQLAIDFMDSLPISNPHNAIWYCLHQAVWHKGVDRVRWLLENKDLVKEICEHPKPMPTGQLKDRFWASIAELKNLDR